MDPRPLNNAVWFAVAENLPEMIAIGRGITDGSGRIADVEMIYLNRYARELTPNHEAVLGRPVSEGFPQMVENGSLAVAIRVLETGAAQSGDSWVTESDSFTAGGYRWTSTPLGDGLVMWNVHDVTAQIQRTAEDRNRFAAAFEASVAGMALVDLTGHIIDANECLAHLVDSAVVDLIGRHISHLSDAERNDAMTRLFHQALDDPAGSTTADLRLSLSDGLSAWIRVSIALVRTVDDAPLMLVMHVLDVSAREGRELELAHAVTHDALTGLPNRSLFVDHLQLLLNRQLAGLTHLVVVVVDLDSFHVVNGSLGHRRGDTVLREVARRLVGFIRPGDTVARLGGDRFAVLCDVPGALPDPAELYGALRAVLAEPIEIGDHRIVVQASAGIVYPGAVDDAAVALRDADTALHEAKRNGRATFEVFDASLRERALGWFVSEAGLRSVLAARRIQSYFQPVVDLVTGETVGFEALARWEQDGVMAGPSAILEMAEATGLVVALSEAVAEQALAGMGRWRGEQRCGAPRPWLSFNISPRQLNSPGFCTWLRERCGASGTDPHDVVLEITERTMLQAGPQTLFILDELRGAGFRIAIDDFGVEYSSLAYLRSLPVDVVKIDRVFVAPAPHDARNQRLLTAIVGLADALGLAVIAEGIETPAEREAVAAAGCRLGQGFGLARPRHHLEPV